MVEVEFEMDEEFVPKFDEEEGDDDEWTEVKKKK